MGVSSYSDEAREEILASVMNNKNVSLERAIDEAAHEFGCSHDYVWGVYMAGVSAWLGPEETGEYEDFYEPDGDVMSFEDPADVVASGEFRLISHSA
jgi:hypothetical protein